MFEDDVYYFFFFFKQKTAYEMRISDWSSDVCSSDLTYWREQDPDRFLWVFVFTMGMLLAPKLMGFIATMFDRDLRRGCGGAVRTFIGMLLETLLAALMAPVTMYVQSRGSQLDILARQYLWADGVDYAHGTGHGVGTYLAEIGRAHV